jgi:hypothetical protein
MTQWGGCDHTRVWERNLAPPSSEPRVQRRRFDHLIMELSLALDRNLPRYPLWLTLKEFGADPDFLSREVAIEFCDEHLDEFLAHLGHALTPRQARRLRRAVARFDPEIPTPYERMASI